jgi:hypothetical protein
MTAAISGAPGRVNAAAGADYRAAVLAGLAAGLAMSPAMMAVTTFMMHMGPWPAAKMAWSLVAGKDVIRPGFELVPVMGGMMVHLALSTAFGLVYAWLTTIVRIGLVGLGVLFGVALYLTNIVIVPSVLPGWAGHMAPPNATMHVVEALLHAFFGFVLGLSYRAWRRV